MWNEVVILAIKCRHANTLTKYKKKAFEKIPANLSKHVKNIEIILHIPWSMSSWVTLTTYFIKMKMLMDALRTERDMYWHTATAWC